MLEGGKNVLKAMLSDGVDEFNLSADINISETDGAWLPVIGETVDIMSIDENQMNKLSLEAMGIAGKLISACSAAVTSECTVCAVTIISDTAHM